MKPKKKPNDRISFEMIKAEMLREFFKRLSGQKLKKPGRTRKRQIERWLDKQDVHFLSLELGSRSFIVMSPRWETVLFVTVEEVKKKRFLEYSWEWQDKSNFDFTAVTA